MYYKNKIKSFTQFLNEFELEGEIQQSKPLWNGKDYLDKYGDISIRGTKLTELPYIFPEVWNKNFYCDRNNLTSLKGAPKIVKGNFHCNNNKLTSLEGAPEKVDGNFDCYYNKLTSLDGAPEEVGGGFDCDYNNLTSLKGAPVKIGKDFECKYNNKLTSLKGAPKEVGRDFNCSDNKTKFTKADVEEICRVEGEIHV